MEISQEKHDQCVREAQTALFKGAAVSSILAGAAWYAAGMYSSKLKATNWRLKAVTSCAVVISCSYYQGERALIDCTQEYKARAFQREMRRKEIAAAREGKQ